MQFEPIVAGDLPFLKIFEPPGWGDLVPRFSYHINSDFCTPLKLVVDAKMVAIGTTIFHKDSAWLASIIVHPDERNKGYGAMITQQLIDITDRSQFTTIYLDATEAGFPVYTKLGFELETTYAHLKAAETITGLQLSGPVVDYDEQFKDQVWQLDKDVSCEERQDTITENLATAKLFVKQGRVKGYYLPSLGNGLIIAENEHAGIALMHYRLENNYYGILPSANKAGILFLEQNGLTQFRISRRMFIGKKRNWKKENIYNRISGQLG